MYMEEVHQEAHSTVRVWCSIVTDRQESVFQERLSHREVVELQCLVQNQAILYVMVPMWGFILEMAR